ncbi:MAG: phosphotransferase, partial [Prolixibacteraceae bacterium]|nr:phosphotransferase [Prolixibacteraceae bacterium]
QGIASYHELGFSVGIGASADSFNNSDKEKGIFISTSNCGGFIPFDSAFFPDFKLPKDTKTSGIVVDWAMSFGVTPSIELKLSKPTTINCNNLLKTLTNDTFGTNTYGLCITDFNTNSPSISVLGIIKEKKFIGNNILQQSVFKSDNNIHFLGAKFVLNQLPKEAIKSPLDQLIDDVLTFENILNIQPIDLTSTLMSPSIWLFKAKQKVDASKHRLAINYPKGSKLTIYEEYLIRRLYTDSSKIEVNALHGGFSAQTFQVESYDLEGRKLRPTVLKIANRDMIKREAERCKTYAMPYILNNSAIVLGTEFHGNIGALRYNFVGIGGEQTKLKWLTHYYKDWSITELEPLFDKIFLQILKPWYGQPILETIHPYTDHNPTLTFFPNLCETAEQEFSISSNNPTLILDENKSEIVNPYWFLKHEFTQKSEYAITYPTSICHGDLNMQNILLDQDMNVYLIDFSETKPRSIVSDFARLEAIFMIENSPLETEVDLEHMIKFVLDFYQIPSFGNLPQNTYEGNHSTEIAKNVALIHKMRNYAFACSNNNENLLPYYMALLEWVLPVVCYSSATTKQKRISMIIAGVLCKKVMEAIH